eukprot:scaffold12292_cov106-Skeletonema_dohrnii-CCMP3373.AAC.1
MQFFKLARLLLLLGVSSQARTASAYDCFDADGTDLKTQVNAYTANPSGYSSSKYGPFEEWCTTPVTTMRALFAYKGSFNANITAWDTSSVTDMANMFRGASIFNQDLSAWDTSSVTDMDYMFQEASAFNQNLCAWKDKFPYSKAVQIFVASGCTDQTTPISDQSAFCAGSAEVCQAYTTATPVPTNSPTNSPT